MNAPCQFLLCTSHCTIPPSTPSRVHLQFKPRALFWAHWPNWGRMEPRPTHGQRPRASIFSSRFLLRAFFRRRLRLHRSSGVSLPLAGRTCPVLMWGRRSVRAILAAFRLSDGSFFCPFGLSVGFARRHRPRRPECLQTKTRAPHTMPLANQHEPFRQPVANSANCTTRTRETRRPPCAPCDRIHSKPPSWSAH